MHPLQNGSQVTERPANKPTSGLPGYFTESGDNNVPSYPGQDWFNDVIDEFLNVLSVMGITFDHNKSDHLSRAFSFLKSAVPFEYLSDAIDSDVVSGFVTTRKRHQYGGGGVYAVTDDVPNGFDKISMSNGKTLTLVRTDKFVTLETLGAEPRDDFDIYPIFEFARNNYKYVTTENSGKFYTSDELVPAPGMVFVSENSSNSTAIDDLELAILPSSLIEPSNWNGKSVVRASLSPVGGSLGLPLSGVVLGPFSIDAEGADYGFYARYLTNESRIHNVVVRNSNLCNICVLTSWFAKYDGLISMRANGKGISLGYPLSGESGDVAVNGIEFEAVRSNFSGQSDANKAKWVDGVDVKQFALDGAGIIIATNACHFPSLQAEKGIGVGIVDLSPFDNSFGSIYTEGNCSQMTTGRADFVGKDSGSGKVVQVQTIFIGSTGDNAYYLEGNVLVDAGAVKRNSAFNTFYANGPQVIMRNANSLVTSNQDVGALAYEQFNCAAFFNVNLRYSSQLDDARFYTDVSLSFPYVVVVPRDTYSLANNLALSIDSNTARSYGTEFNPSVNYRVRHPSLSSGSHKINSAGTLPSSDFFADIYVFERRPATGFNEVG
ncbi:hypothetical protein P3598_13205 [Vibrio parahaemolyticus]|nr:hypothetical protein [Vibrio parahaemolyticus]MDF5112216.1 hypothetical protein [Vibrio parahaemolyticus]MDF5127136.1 hypothetical protein [Vibrio parahaemolyticus]MDG2546198.1 hypothetical protein [Vibrio parahaemolyticus]MDG2555980.1 hypothetical protein [Vibrio parahaemolyticus]